MAKTKKVLSLFLVALMTVFTVLSYVPAKAATAPKLSVVTQPAAEYTPDQTISFTVNAHYAGKVMYRVILYNGTTKTTSNLWNTPKTGYYYTKWTPAGTMNFSIHWGAKQLQSGYYSMTVLAKRVGSKAKYDTYVDTHSFYVKSSVAISSIDDVTATVEQGATYTLPATVTAKMSDGTTKDVAVVWTPATVDTTKAGDQKFVGKVEGYEKDVNLTLTVNELQVKSVSAIGASKLKVVMSAPVDTTKATFEVKNGSFLVPVTATWNDTKTEATLTKTYGKYIAGDYAVTVKGLNITAGKDAGKVTVADEAIDTIKFNSTTLLKTGTTTATIGYTVLNQYGEDITKTATINGVSSFGTVVASAGTATVTKANAGTWASTDTTGSVTLYNGTKVATATVTLADLAAINSLTLGSMILPTDAVRLIPSATVQTVNISFTAVDQYGNSLTLSDLSGITAVYGGGISNATIITDPNDSTKKVIRVNVPVVDVKTTAALTLIVNGTGKTSTVSFDMYPAAKVADFTLTPDTKVIKAGTAYKVWIDAVDTYGDAIAASELATDDTQFAITSLNTDVFTVGGIDYDSVAKKAYIPVTPVAAGKSASLVVTLKANGKNATLPINVNAASQIVGMTLSANTFNFAANGSATLKASFIDQYNEAVKDLAGYTVEFTTSDATVIVAPTPAKTIAEMVAGVAIAPATDIANKTATLTVTLKNGSTTIDSQDVAIKVIDSAKTTLTYSIADIDKLHGLATFDNTSDYAATISLTAKDAAGNTIYVPSSVIKSVTSSNNALVSVSPVDGTYYVCGLAAGIPTGSTEASATLTVIVENYDGTVSIATKAVTVSNAQIAAASLKAYLADGTEVTGDIDGFDSTKVIDSSRFTKVSGSVTNGTTFYFEALDQYGVGMNIPTFIVTNLPTGVTYTVSNGVITLSRALTSGESFNVTAVTANGLYKTVKVVF